MKLNYKGLINKNNMKMKVGGFTMIELLIVISVLGILAVGLLAAVDPFEQLKKARDTNTRQSVLALQTSLVRYYATHGALPWNNASLTNAGAGCYDLFGVTAPSGTALSDAGMTACVTDGPEADGELKAGFVDALGTSVADQVFVTSSSTSSVSVCFAPQSKSIRAEENVKFDASGTDLTTGGTPSCDSAWKAANPTDFATCHYCAM